MPDKASNYDQWQFAVESKVEALFDDDVTLDIGRNSHEHHVFLFHEFNIDMTGIEPHMDVDEAVKIIRQRIWDALKEHWNYDEET